MYLFSLYLVAGSVALSAASHAHNQKDLFETSVDPGGCLVEHVAVDPLVRQFHYDGLSPDGDKLAVGWDRGEGESGLFILDLKTGARQPVPGLNNGAVFSPDGKYVYFNSDRKPAGLYRVEINKNRECVKGPVR